MRKDRDRLYEEFLDIAREEDVTIGPDDVQDEKKCQWRFDIFFYNTAIPENGYDDILDKMKRRISRQLRQVFIKEHTDVTQRICNYAVQIFSFDVTFFKMSVKQVLMFFINLMNSLESMSVENVVNKIEFYGRGSDGEFDNTKVYDITSSICSKIAKHLSVEYVKYDSSIYKKFTLFMECYNCCKPLVRNPETFHWELIQLLSFDISYHISGTGMLDSVYDIIEIPYDVKENIVRHDFDLMSIKRESMPARIVFLDEANNDQTDLLTPSWKYFDLVCDSIQNGFVQAYGIGVFMKRRMPDLKKIVACVVYSKPTVLEIEGEERLVCICFYVQIDIQPLAGHRIAQWFLKSCFGNDSKNNEYNSAIASVSKKIDQEVKKYSMNEEFIGTVADDEMQEYEPLNDTDYNGYSRILYVNTGYDVKDIDAFSRNYLALSRKFQMFMKSSAMVTEFSRPVFMTSSPEFYRKTKDFVCLADEPVPYCQDQIVMVCGFNFRDDASAALIMRFLRGLAKSTSGKRFSQFCFVEPENENAYEYYDMLSCSWTQKTIFSFLRSDDPETHRDFYLCVYLIKLCEPLDLTVDIINDIQKLLDRKNIIQQTTMTKMYASVYRLYNNMRIEGMKRSVDALFKNLKVSGNVMGLSEEIFCNSADKDSSFFASYNNIKEIKNHKLLDKEPRVPDEVNLFYNGEDTVFVMMVPGIFKLDMKYFKNRGFKFFALGLLIRIDISDFDEVVDRVMDIWKLSRQEAMKIAQKLLEHISK